MTSSGKHQPAVLSSLPVTRLERRVVFEGLGASFISAVGLSSGPIGSSCLQISQSAAELLTCCRWAGDHPLFECRRSHGCVGQRSYLVSDRPSR